MNFYVFFFIATILKKVKIFLILCLVKFLELDIYKCPFLYISTNYKIEKNAFFEFKA